MTKEIALSKGLVALVDDDDYPAMGAIKWSATRNSRKKHWYAVSELLGERRYMHREIMRPQPGMVVDHINGSTLDNRRSNLRVCSHKQNLWNNRHPVGAAGYTGVYWKPNFRPSRRWAAQIKVGGKNVQLGGYPTQEEAARAYDSAAVRFRGEFARLNFPAEKVA